ncbi:MAG: hypothetical protein HKM95_18170 [Inquilinus sp.]|nr:hypothetical protein [Inquilinus sp.]
MSTQEDFRRDGNDDGADFVRELRGQLRRFWAYARSRPAESWGFFAAGFVLALILT